MAQTVVGFFDNQAEAQRAVEQLVSNGFDRSRIDVSSGAGRGTDSMSTSQSTDTMSTSGSRDNDGDRENGITRFFKNLFGDDDDEATRYSRVGMRSNSIVTVHAQSSDEAERAADLLDDYGAVNVNERDAEYSSTGASGNYDRSSSDRSTSDYTGTSSDTDYNRTSAFSDTDRRSDVGDTSDRDSTINRVEEDLQIGKRTVETGGVRVRSRIVERPVEENIRLREEHVTVERNPVDRPVGREELANFEERDIELTERAEVPVVNKEARVVEEIRVSKDVDEREETIRDTVRSTEVDVENLGTNNTRGTTDLNTGNTSNTSNLDTDYDDDTTRNRNTRID